MVVTILKQKRKFKKKESREQLALIITVFIKCFKNNIKYNQAKLYTKSHRIHEGLHTRLARCLSCEGFAQCCTAFMFIVLCLFVRVIDGPTFLKVALVLTAFLPDIFSKRQEAFHSSSFIFFPGVIPLKALLPLRRKHLFFKCQMNPRKTCYILFI